MAYAYVVLKFKKGRVYKRKVYSERHLANYLECFGIFGGIYSWFMRGDQTTYFEESPIRGFSLKIRKLKPNNGVVLCVD